MTAELVTKTQLEAEIRPLNQTAGGKEAPVTRLEVRGYLFLNELQPGSIKRDTQTPAGVRQTPPFLGERHHKRERDTVLDLQPRIEQHTEACKMQEYPP